MAIVNFHWIGFLPAADGQTVAMRIKKQSIRAACDSA
jgi:hypothetical protein